MREAALQREAALRRCPAPGSAQHQAVLTTPPGTQLARPTPSRPGLQVMTLAQHKYASNVVEACLKHGCQAHRDAIVE